MIFFPRYTQYVCLLAFNCRSINHSKLISKLSKSQSNDKMSSRYTKHHDYLKTNHAVPGQFKERGASKMVTNRFMPNLTMLKYIKRRLS